MSERLFAGEEGTKFSRAWKSDERKTVLVKGKTHSIEVITSLFRSMTRFWTRALRVSEERTP